jgi:hypothetical protein
MALFGALYSSLNLDFYADSDPDPAFQNDADPDPQPWSETRIYSDGLKGNHPAELTSPERRWGNILTFLNSSNKSCGNFNLNVKECIVFQVRGGFFHVRF